jgi:hypothetical protein
METASADLGADRTGFGQHHSGDARTTMSDLRPALRSVAETGAAPPARLTGGRKRWGSLNSPGKPCLEKEILDFRAFEENPAVAMLPDGIKPQKLLRTPHISFVTTWVRCKPQMN